MKVNKGFVLRQIAGEYVIIPTGNTVLTFNGLISVNEVGAFLWKLLQEDATFDELAKRVLEEYDVDDDTAREDIQDFIDRLAEAKILEIE